MKKQTIALVASGLLLASGMTFAQEDTNAAAGTGSTTTGATGGLDTFSGVALVTVAAGLAYAAASDGSGSGSSGTTGTTGTTE